MIETAEEFIRLRQSENQNEYFRAAHDQAPLEIWHEVIEKHPDMAFWVAQNKTVPYQLLELLADHQEARVRSMVASKNKLKEILLIKLASDPDDSVRMNIARHKKATATVLRLLVNDSWSEIKNLAMQRIADGNYEQNSI